MHERASILQRVLGLSCAGWHLTKPCIIVSCIRSAQRMAGESYAAYML